jgi:hypothetical protein
MVLVGPPLIQLRTPASSYRLFWGRRSRNRQPMRPCPLWVISRHRRADRERPLYLLKRTSSASKASEKPFEADVRQHDTRGLVGNVQLSQLVQKPLKPGSGALHIAL